MSGGGMWRKATLAAMRNPDVEVEAVFTSKSRRLGHAHLETSLGKLVCLQNAWGFTALTLFISFKSILFNNTVFFKKNCEIQY